MRISVPYSITGDYLEAINQEFDRCKPGEWLVIKDGDVCFLFPKFGHQILEYIKKWPDTGLFTCYASRCHYSIQRIPGDGHLNPSVSYHQKEAIRLASKPLHVTDINRHIAGHLMVIKKDTWDKIKGHVNTKVSAKSKKILGVDTIISRQILNMGFKIRRMDTVYVLHYLRFNEGYDFKGHLK